MMLKKLQNSALERPNASQLSRQVLPPKNVMAIAPKVRQVFCMCPDLRSVNCPATKSDRISAARLDPDGCAAQSDVNLHSEFASFLGWKREC